MSADIVDPAMQPGNFCGALAILSRPFHAARAGTANVPQLFERSLQRPWVGDPFKDLAALVSDGRQPTNPDVDPDPRVRQRHLRLDRSLHQYPHTRVDPGSVAAHRNRKHPRPPFRNQAFDPAHVLMGTDGADHRQCQMAAVRFYAHRTGGETYPIAVAALFLEPRESDSFPGAIARARGLPIPVRVYRAADSVCVGLLRAFRPPHRTGLSVDTHAAFDRVPPFPQHLKRR